MAPAVTPMSENPGLAEKGMGEVFSVGAANPVVGQFTVPFDTNWRYTLKLLTAGQDGEGEHSVQVSATQWNPVPIRDTVTVLAGAAPVTVSVPERFPPCVGVKVTLIMQLARPFSTPGQLFVWPKSPLATMLEIVTLELELLVRVTTEAELVSVIWVPGKVRFVKFAVSEGVTVTVPVVDVVPVFAVTVTGVLPLTVPPVTIKV